MVTLVSGDFSCIVVAIWDIFSAILWAESDLRLLVPTCKIISSGFFLIAEQIARSCIGQCSAGWRRYSSIEKLCGRSCTLQTMKLSSMSHRKILYLFWKHGNEIERALEVKKTKYLRNIQETSLDGILPDFLKNWQKIVQSSTTSVQKMTMLWYCAQRLSRCPNYHHLQGIGQPCRVWKPAANITIGHIWQSPCQDFHFMD